MWLLVPLFAAAFVVGMNFRYVRGNYDPPPANLPAVKIAVQLPQVRSFTEVLPARQGVLLVDIAHRNQFNEEEINILLGRVADIGYTVEFLNDFQEMPGKLKRADSFLVILPGTRYSESEAAVVREYVDTGGKLLLIGDPTRSSNINNLARVFGMVFQPGFLYNVAEHDLNFQNIFIRDFRPHDVTEGLEQIAFYNAGSISTSGLPLALTDNNTFSSMVERTEAFSPLVGDSSGCVLGIFDLTFMISPNNAIWDNERFIANLADYLTKSERILFE